jgi:hypothetical protein
MKKQLFYILCALPVAAMVSCGEVKEDVVEVKINGVQKHYEDELSKWFTTDSQTGIERFEFWCYTESGNVDEDFFRIKGPDTQVGTHVIPCGESMIGYVTPSGTFCDCDTAYYTVTEYNEDQSMFDPFITFKGTFYARLIEQGTGNVYEFTDGMFEIHEK